MVGDPWPRPGMGVVQASFEVSLHVVGTDCGLAACPSAVGPRHAGQSSEGPASADARAVETMQRMGRFKNEDRGVIFCIVEGLERSLSRMCTL